MRTFGGERKELSEA